MKTCMYNEFIRTAREGQRDNYWWPNVGHTYPAPPPEPVYV